jgi:hypothetical protein
MLASDQSPLRRDHGRFHFFTPDGREPAVLHEPAGVARVRLRLPRVRRGQVAGTGPGRLDRDAMSGSAEREKPRCQPAADCLEVAR